MLLDNNTANYQIINRGKKKEMAERYLG